MEQLIAVRHIKVFNVQALISGMQRIATEQAVEVGVEN
jgi:hypothetical protein